MMAKRNKLPVILELAEARRLLFIPNKRYLTGRRNRAILSVMLNIGLRVSEVANLKPGNVNLIKGKLRVLHGKYGKDRDLTIPRYTIEILDQWERLRPKSDYFFSTLKGNKLLIRYIEAMVERYRKRAKIDKNVTPHTLRHYVECYIMVSEEVFA